MKGGAMVAVRAAAERGITLVAVAFSGVLFAGCGSSGPGGSTASAPVAYGSPTTGAAAAPSTVPAVSAVTTTRAAPAATAAPPTVARPAVASHDPCQGSAQAGPVNVSRRDDPTGFRLTLTVADKLCFARGDDIRLQIEIANISTHPLQYDSNQVKHFEIAGASSPQTSQWDDAKCSLYGKDPGQPIGPPITLAPGDSVILDQATYPGPADSSTREQCRTLSGSLDVVGIVRWCPSGTTAKGYCDPGRSTDVRSAPVAIEIR